MRGFPLSIAGLDPSGGAGLFQDLRVFSALGLPGQGVPTALTVQSIRGVRGASPVDPALFFDMLSALSDGGEPSSVKIGLMPVSLVGALSDYLDGLPGDVFRILDPVFLYGTGGSLHSPQDYREMARALFPRVDLVTPNIPEAQELTGAILERTPEDLVFMAHRLRDQFGARAVLLKGGHQAGTGERTDLLLTSSGERLFLHPFLGIPGIHGGGCTLSSLVAGLVARGTVSLGAAVEEALSCYQKLLSKVSGEGRSVLDPDLLRRPSCDSPPSS
ncbi:MAG: hydroxymethylpyrimidine/phosphomethylpyrimidine kinase [Leptospirillia bacterium]